MDLFQDHPTQFRSPRAPLAFRIRPRTLSEMIGQEDLLGNGSLLRRLIEEDRIQSAIFFGPPGSGKTSLVNIIGSITSSHFITISAVTSNVARIKEIIAGARNRLANTGKSTLLFVDEFHRFNRAQQEVLLPHIEDGTIAFIGLTTSNPFHAMAPALLSRSQLFQFPALSPDSIAEILQRALTDPDRGLGNYSSAVSEEAIAWLAQYCEGDARRGLNILELAIVTTPPGEAGKIIITAEIMAGAAQEKLVSYDRNGDEHYNTISAFIKSVRGSDPDAALYWLAKMIRGGEDYRFLARRLIILASEDIGNADPHALTLAVDAAQAVEFVGTPEGQLALAQATTYLASAPKSNASYLGLKKALRDIDKKPLQAVPSHLKNVPHRDGGAASEEKPYLSPHRYPGGWVKQDYLKIKRQYYYPTDRGYEAVIKKRMKLLRSNQTGL
ncbi:MAG: replication-associated recombination protein A [Candidatus Euphemobacter frigidus]|nr:replication-associated recombination protein A [Candidatus Euphemobacter frigidus]MDP8274837.1 replication-associated recombination protein A [Candidatus Euphemobacter frigidus]